jgi:hypothetical protein
VYTAWAESPQKDSSGSTAAGRSVLTGGDLRREGTIGRVWQWIDEANEQRLALTELSVRCDHAITDPSRHGAGAGQLGGARPRWTAAMIDAEGGSDDRRNAFS